MKKFNNLGEDLCIALDTEHPPQMIKKDRFIAGLKATLEWKVELKRPTNFDEAIDIANNKEWKMQRMTQLGMGPLIVKPTTCPLGSQVTTGLVSTIPPIVHTSPQVILAAPTPPQDEELRHDKQQMLDMMKNLNLNLMSK